MRNKEVPNEVEIFVWRSNLNCLPTRVELDKGGVDLDSILSPSCQACTESVEHILVHCTYVSKVWDQVIKWWNLENHRTSNIEEAFVINPNVISSNITKQIWQAVRWICGYIIWKHRNLENFSRKVWIILTILNEIQIQRFFWISKRLKKTKIDWHQWLINPNSYVVPQDRFGIG
ncbi:uncharacterized protein [Rutidosis leptorrhynchoides]|uniref:uncharacterized protein n=1 Tax=Rutidosis leptorrhynchoides TaxID=125765 RepID=UPI003A9A1C2C